MYWSFRGPWGPWGVLGGPWGAWGVLGSRRLLEILMISSALCVKVRSKDKFSYGLLSNIDYFIGFVCKNGRMGQTTLGIIDNKKGTTKLHRQDINRRDGPYGDFQCFSARVHKRRCQNRCYFVGFRGGRHQNIGNYCTNSMCSKTLEIIDQNEGRSESVGNNR